MFPSDPDGAELVSLLGKKNKKEIYVYDNNN